MLENNEDAKKKTNFSCRLFLLLFLQQYIYIKHFFIIFLIGRGLAQYTKQESDV